MKIVKEIFGRIWALWGLLTFVATFLLALIASLVTYNIKGVKGQAIFITISRVWMNVWLTLIACPIKIKGRENFKAGEAYVVTCNHNSLMDPPLSCPFIPGANKTIAKSSFAKVPLFALYYKRGAVLVNRKSEESRRRSFLEMKHTLQAGMHMSIYPEGTRNRTGQPLKTFHDGAFKLAVETGKKVIPAVLFNTGKVLPVNKTFYLMPHRLSIHFLPAVEVKGKTANELKQEVFNLMWHYYEENS